LFERRMEKINEERTVELTEGDADVRGQEDISFSNNAFASSP